MRQQHKKCAEMLRHIYDLMLSKQLWEAALTHYNEIQEWMSLSPLMEADLKNIADRYHYHLQHAHVNIRENNLLPHVRKGDKECSTTPPLPIAIYLDSIRSAFNVGSIVRTTEALALGSIFFSETTPFIDNRQVQNTSMDTYQWIPCHRNIPLDQLPKPIIAMEPSDNAISIHDFIFPHEEPFTLVLGNEEYGCSDASLRQSDYLIEIPVYGKKNSLNVANAFAMAAVEIQRQKKLS